MSNQTVDIPNAIVEFDYATLSTNLIDWQWDFGDGAGSDKPTPVYQYQNPGLYDILLTVTDANGCTHTVTYEQYIEVLEKIRVFAPNAFSPNGDGLNDQFFVTHRLIQSLEVAIFDRWGKVLFTSNNVDFRWDGKSVDGKDMPEGAYTFRVNFVDIHGQQGNVSGTVTLLR